MSYVRETCDDCSRYNRNDTKNSYSNYGYCNYYRSYYDPGSEACRYFVSRSGGSGGCYITTVVSDILKKKDDCKVLETLRGFRDSVLQKNEKYAGILYEYDTVGPRIADAILDDYDTSFCNDIYNNYLVPISQMIDKKQYLGAIFNYQNLTNSLKVYYHIEDDFKDFSNYIYQNGGHGSLQYKKNKI